MSDTILAGNWTVYYFAENRQKRIVWSGAATATNTVNEVYSALQNLMDELTQLDDGSVMSAQTPTEYTIGIIDPNDSEPWFIDRESVEHLTGGALKTASWLRVTDTRAGILKIVCNNTSIVVGDIGLTITHADGDSGTLLDVQGTATGSVVWIRPDTSAAANDFNTAIGTLTVNTTHTAVQEVAAASGEGLWANIYNTGLATLPENTHQFVYQDDSSLVAYKDTTDWWSDGQIDILINVKEVGVESDEGYITVLARQYGKTFTSFIVDLSAGGRNPIPLSSGNDLDNTTGYRQMVLTTASADFTVGEVIEDDSDDTIQGIVTSNTGTAPNTTIQYYLIGDPLTDFTVSTGGFTGATSASTGTAVDPTDVGPALLTGVTIAHGNTTADIDENGTNENYSITITCNSQALTDVYERTKYLTRRGETSTTSTDTIEGEQYIGSDYRLVYTGVISGTFSEGEPCTQANTGATGTIVSSNVAAKIIILRNSRGTFNTTDLITEDTNSGTVTPDSAATVITPIIAAPFGTFAGGKFFCAPGVLLSGYLAGDANNFQLVDDTGTVVVAPTKVTVTVGNSRVGDTIAVFRLTAAGGTIEKDTYTGTVQAVEATSVVVFEDIDSEEPGKATGGILRIVDDSESLEYRIRYSSWASKTFTLASSEIVQADAATTTTIQETGAFTNSKVGDLVYNVTRTAYSYITVITDNDNVTISPAIAAQTNNDNIKLNVLPVATTVSDSVYVPFIDAYETTGTSGVPGTETASVTYSTDIAVRIRARHAGDILPYEADATIGSTGLTNNIIRTSDTIYT